MRKPKLKDYPKGYTFDLALLRPLVPIVLRIHEPQERKFRKKAVGLPFNEILCILSARIGSEERALPSGFGTTIGEEFVKANVRFYKDADD